MTRFICRECGKDTHIVYSHGNHWWCEKCEYKKNRSQKQVIGDKGNPEVIKLVDKIIK